VSVTCAGRTDRGVHAREQVVHFDTDAERPDSAWVRGVNALLPESVAVLWSHRVNADFSARYSARARTYRYVLLNRAVRPALMARYAGWFHSPLNEQSMRAAAAHLVGEHDFSAFRSAECQAKSPVRTLHSLEIERRGERIDFVLRANAFLHHMVRNIVGTLLYVGKGKHPPQWAREILDSRDRSRAAPTFQAEGLYLERVEYEARWDLPQAGKGSLTIPVIP
jgi:tRNA pseudouridine38-40 synthase